MVGVFVRNKLWIQNRLFPPAFYHTYRLWKAVEDQMQGGGTDPRWSGAGASDGNHNGAQGNGYRADELTAQDPLHSSALPIRMEAMWGQGREVCACVIPDPLASSARVAISMCACPCPLSCVFRSRLSP